jgi:membrane protein implicated in regulation of membrane protease activity
MGAGCKQRTPASDLLGENLMVLIGLLLIAAAVAAAIILVVQNDHTIAVHVFNTDYSVAAYWLAIAGLAIMAVLALGLWALRAGAAHRMRLRRERRELVRENRRLSERAATLNQSGTGQGSGPTTNRLRPGTAPGGASAGSDGAHPDHTGSRVDEPGRRPSAEG